MVEVRQNGGEGEMADSHATFARLADASAKLFAEQAAAMAAMTAFGISMAGQMTGLMLGTFKPSEDEAADARPDRRPIGVVQADGNVVHLRSTIGESDGVADAASKAVENIEVVPAAVIEPSRPGAKPVARVTKTASRRAATEAVVVKAASRATRATSKSMPTAEPAADDLKRISGIGPRLEKVLNGRGISTYAGIASLSKAALKKIDDELGLEGRVIRDDWVGQAKALTAGGSDAAR